MAHKRDAALRRRLTDFRRVADDAARNGPNRKKINKVIEALEEFTLKLPKRPNGLKDGEYVYHMESIQAELDWLAQILRDAR